MTKLSRKLLISMFTLAFALVTLGATTFAWFTLTSVAEIDTLEMEIIAGNYMEISLDGTNYKTFFTSQEIKEAILEGIGEGEDLTLPRLDAVSTADGRTFVDMEGNPKNSFLSFKIWFKSYTQGSIVYLDTGTEIDSTSKTWKADKAFTYRGNPVLLNDQLNIFAGNAMRFSIEETAVDHETQVAMQIFELGSKGDNDQPLGTELKPNNGLLSYWKAKTATDEEEGETLELPTGFVLPPVLSGTALGSPVTANVATTDTETNVEGEVTSYVGYAIVRIWLEGWDPDSFDAVLNSKMNIKFSFSVATPEEVVEP